MHLTYSTERELLNDRPYPAVPPADFIHQPVKETPWDPLHPPAKNNRVVEERVIAVLPVGLESPLARVQHKLPVAPRAEVRHIEFPFASNYHRPVRSARGGK